MDKIIEIEKKNGFILPEQYRQFLLECDGISFSGGLILYAIEELKQMNEDMEVQKYLENYIAIGDDGGGLVFLMKQDRSSTEVIFVDMSDYDINEPYSRVDDFRAWYNAGCIINEKKENEYGHVGDIYLVKSLENGIKDILLLKKVFKLDIPTAKLVGLSKQIPCKLVENIKYAKALKLIDETGHAELFEFRAY